MSDLGKINFLKGSLRYKRAPEIGLEITIPLSGKMKELDDFSITKEVDLPTVYDNERESSQIYIPLSKFQLIFSNEYKGVAMTPTNIYNAFNNNLFYYNVEATKLLQVNSSTTIQWPGYPQYNEFSFIRTDNNTPGYTTGFGKHVDFKNSESSFYNWYYYMTYVSENSTTTNLEYQFSSTNTVSWVPSEGLPYVMNLVQDFNGRTLWQFTCPCKHNLSIGEFVKLDGVVLKTANGVDLGRDMIFEVYSLGDGTFKSSEKIFNILDVNFFTNVNSPTSFHDGQTGKFFRVLDRDNPIESQSKYYVRKHKVITKWNDAVVTNAGFEQNAFRTVKKFFSNDLTPNQNARIATKEDSQSYNISFNGSIDLSNYRDNQGRPITEIFVTIVNRGYFGYFHPISNGSKSLKRGWEFNISTTTNSWWERTNINSDVDLEIDSFTKNVGGGTVLQFNRMKNYNVGDLIDGDLCEWNEFTQEETILSKLYHKFVYNPSTFNIGVDNFNPTGFYYRPFYRIKLKEYSDYVETGVLGETENVPDYSFFSRNNNSFFWRDIYTIGYIDANDRGVDYPFMNGRHYPYNNFIFRIIPEGTSDSTLYDIQTPLIDGCE